MAAEHDDEETWARFLVENVFFDVAGFPVVLRSDRGPAFVSKVVREVNNLLEISHVFGTAFHPQSQGYIEGRHKSVNNTLAAYVSENPGRWARWVKLAQWAKSLTQPTKRYVPASSTPLLFVNGFQLINLTK